jgi:hypothetical protein
MKIKTAGKVVFSPAVIFFLSCADIFVEPAIEVPPFKSPLAADFESREAFVVN